MGLKRYLIARLWRAVYYWKNKAVWWQELRSLGFGKWECVCMMNKAFTKSYLQAHIGARKSDKRLKREGRV